MQQTATPSTAFAAPPVPCIRHVLHPTSRRRNLAALLVASFTSLHPAHVRGAQNSVARDSAPQTNCIPSSDVKDRLRAAKVFCFDVDSTVITSEGIDELAATCGVKEEVEKLTAQAMGGGLPFHESLRARLDIMRPTKQQVENVHVERPFAFSPHVKELVTLLHARGAEVYLISGGFKEMILPLATELAIEADQVYANELRFNADGSFRSFNPQAWTAAAGGKKRAIEHIRTLHSGDGDATVVMVGDGATDLEARDCYDGQGGADVMVGYGGNVVRGKVEAGADWFVKDFQLLIRALDSEEPETRAA